MPDDDTSPADDGSPVRVPLSRRILFSFVLLFVLVLLIEGGFRLAGLGRPEVTPRWDPDYTETTLAAPDGHRSVYRERIQAGVPVRINEHSFRDWQYDPAAPSSEKRIVALGDSFTFGQGVELDETWPRLLETGLANGSDSSPRVLNFGRRGANTKEEVELFHELALPYAPKVVALGITLFNDAETRAYYQSVTKKRAKAKRPMHRRVIKWFHEHSYAVRFVVDRVKRPSTRAGMVRHIEKQYADDAEGYLECREALKGLAETCRGKGIPLIVFVFPVHYDDIGLNDWEAYDFTDTHEKLRNAFSSFPEVEYIDLVPHLRSLAGKQIWVEGDRHPNALYHRLVADVITPVVKKALALGR
jgi:GDSL-like Lipase/Acylhydrolase family